ncbi:MAG TPA: hypothetical protein VFD37_01665, partial [Solirubrobacterales bacterium]|nr:hypothetical protein [Solirubrobacterales bacterium]
MVADRAEQDRSGRRTAWAVPAALVVAVALLLGGCDGSADEPEPKAKVTDSRPAPPATDFPAVEGRTLGEVIDQADPPQPHDPVVTPGTQVFYPGTNRYTFTLADRDRNEITEAEVALYIAPIPVPAGSA